MLYVHSFKFSIFVVFTQLSNVKSDFLILFLLLYSVCKIFRYWFFYKIFTFFVVYVDQREIRQNAFILWRKKNLGSTLIFYLYFAHFLLQTILLKLFTWFFFLRLFVLSCISVLLFCWFFLRVLLKSYPFMITLQSVSHTIVTSSSVLSLSHDHCSPVQNHRKSLLTHSRLHENTNTYLARAALGNVIPPLIKIGMGWGEHKTHIHSAILLRREIKRKQEDCWSTISLSGTFCFLGSYAVPYFF